MAKERRYFFLNEQLHRRVLVNRGKDLLWAWNYPEHSRMTYTYTDALRRMEPAFTSTQVAKIMGRHKNVIERAVWRGNITSPQYSYGLETKTKDRYYWSEKDILNLLDFLSGIHQGRPRKDGLIKPKHLPTPREVRAIVRDDKVMFGDKNYRPSFIANNIRR